MRNSRRLAGVAAAPEKKQAPGNGQGVVEWSSSSLWLTRVITAVILVAVLAGPVGLAVALVKRNTVAPIVTASSGPAIDPREQAAVGQFAAAFVRAWLQATSGSAGGLNRYLGGLSATVTTSAGFAVTDVDVAGLHHVSAGEWAVTVAALGVTPSTSGSGTSPVTSMTVPGWLYFQVPVHYQSTAMVAEALPAVVAGPAATAVPSVAYTTSISVSTPVGKAVQEFLGALLTGSGDVSRLESPGSAIAAVTPAPYSTVSVTTVSASSTEASSPAPPATGDRVQVLASATAALDSTHQLGVQYALTLTGRTGRWEVTSLDPVPAKQPH